MTEELADDPDEESAVARAADRSSGQRARGDIERDEPCDDEHLEDLPDGSGCTEIWEHVSEERADDD